jgi:NAD(P)-dependent dehydrogenase (short-subunit alcohol dehydrogenase family)
MLRRELEGPLQPTERIERMKNFADRIAVITGGGTGMGRELALQLAKEGCHISICDVSDESMATTLALCQKSAPAGTRLHAFEADVSEEEQVLAFRDAVMQAHDTDCIHLLFNNAGIGAGGSFLLDDRDDWEKTFAVCWGGVYFSSRAFIPLLVAAPEGHLINTSSVNGFWASLGPMTAHTAYSSAKFAVKGFTESLINDFRINAPHVKVSLVMPGHIGTSIVINSNRILGHDPKELSNEELDGARDRMAQLGFDIGPISNDEMRQALQQRAEDFRDQAPVSAAEAAGVILEGVRDERWRILIGEDAHALDRLVRESPEEAYELSFMERLLSITQWQLGDLANPEAMIPDA